MTMSERHAFYKTCMGIDEGQHQHSYHFYLKREVSLDAFQGFLSLMGFSGHLCMQLDCPGYDVRTKSSTELTLEKLQASTEEHYRGTVWCIEVPTGAFVVRRHGHVFITGNSQGFPKSLNISKAIAKLDGDHAEDAKKWSGWGTALKPAWEPILCFRKPVEEPSITEQVATTGTGGINIDDTRIKHANAADLENHKAMVAALKARGGQLGNSWKNSSDLSGANEVKEGGRWPSNVVMVHAVGCQKTGTDKVPAPVINRFEDGMKPFGGGAGHQYTSTPTGDSEGNETVDVYECVEGCPVRALEQQSSSSRYFGQFVPEAPFFYSAKASRSERNGAFPIPKNKSKDKTKFVVYKIKEDVETDTLVTIHEALSEVIGDFDPETERFENSWFQRYVPENLREHFEMDAMSGGNDHPSVKPVALMRYLVKLVTPVGGIVLDPYCGSGTTCLAAAESGMQFIGIERDPHFFEIAQKRVMTVYEKSNLERNKNDLFSAAEDLPED